MEQKFPENVETVDTPVPEQKVPASAPAPAPKKVIGRPITKETAKQYQLSAAAAKARRKKVRSELLARLTTDFDLAEEMKKALMQHDEQYLNMCEKAMRIIGLHYDQSEEGREKNLNLKGDMNLKKATAVQVLFTDARPKDAEVKVED